MKVSVLISLLVILSLTGCNNIRYRLNTPALIQDVEKFRNAQQVYSDKYGNGAFGSVHQLIDKKLLEERFADLKEHGYRFNLTVENEHYNLIVVPEAEENKAASDDSDELSLYVDETGIIRASVKRNEPANAKSSPISPK